LPPPPSPPQPFRPLPDWEFRDYLGWIEQGDGKLAYGVYVQVGNGVKALEWQTGSGLGWAGAQACRHCAARPMNSLGTY